ncbi:MAG TPA: hypothetical protein VFQ41_07315 [Candidatus Angelobacter sp.]|nr:hypothetical protein [Candidatus Angelobacter sp.]
MANLERSMSFYGDVLGLELAQVCSERKVKSTAAACYARHCREVKIKAANPALTAECLRLSR